MGAHSSFRLLLQFVHKKTKTPPSNLCIQDLDAPMILSFLDSLEQDSVPVHPEMETERFPLVSIPPFGRGFSRHGGLPIRWGFGKSAKGDFRARLHRLDEPTRLSLGKDASPQSLLPFHLAEPL